MLTVPTTGEKLREYRRRAVLTQEDLAERAGVGVATVIRVERDQIEPRVQTVRKLAAALDVEPRELIGD